MPIAALKPRNAVESLRDIVQDLLVPEIKAIKADVSNLNTKIDLLHSQTMQSMSHLDEKFTASIDNLDKKVTASINTLDEKFTASIDNLDKKVAASINNLDEKLSASINTLDTKFSASMDVRERLAVLEDRIKRN